jgi:hypothetical protein
MSSSALSAARNNAYRQLESLVDVWHPMDGKPSAMIALANALDARIAALQTGVELLRYEAMRAKEEQKDVPA